jgi:hypothetical protein
MDDFTTLYACAELFLVSLSLLFVFTHIQYALVQSSGRLAVYWSGPAEQSFRGQFIKSRQTTAGVDQNHILPRLSLLVSAGANTRVFHKQKLRSFSATGFCALRVACFWPPLSRHSYLPKACESTRNRARNSTRMESSVGSSSVSIRVPKCMPSAGMWTTCHFASVLIALGRSTSDGYSVRVLSLPMRLSSRMYVGGY